VTEVTEIPDNYELLIDSAGAFEVPEEMDTSDAVGRLFNPATGTLGDRPPVVPNRNHLSQLEFFSLITPAQFLALDDLEKAGDPTVRYAMAMMRAATYIDLDDFRVQTGLGNIAVVHPTVLPASEVTRILAGQPPVA
jgi:hypothetical protein